MCVSGSMMVCGMLLPTSEIFVKKIKGKINSDKIKNIRENAIPIIRDLEGDDFGSNKTIAARMFRQKFWSFLKKLA